MVWSGIHVRYKQTVVDIAWSLICLVLMMVVMALIFSRVVELPSDGVPHPILVSAVLLP